MLRTAWLLTGGDWALAEDLAQAAFSEVWRHWPRVSVLRHALGQLTAKQRAVSALRYFEDRSEAETAAIMGCTVGTVKSQASRAIAKLPKQPGLTDTARSYLLWADLAQPSRGAVL